MSLTKKQREFAKGVASGKTYTQAAIEAGYSKKTAASTGSENMKKNKVLEAIDNYQEIQRKAIQRRFSGIVDSMLTELIRVYYDDETSPRDKSSIFKDIADRAGFKPVDKSEVDMNAEVSDNQTAKLFEKYLKADDTDDDR